MAVAVVANTKMKKRLTPGPTRRVTSAINATLIRMSRLRRPRRNAAVKKCRKWINPSTATGRGLPGRRPLPNPLPPPPYRGLGGEIEGGGGILYEKMKK